MTALLRRALAPLLLAGALLALLMPSAASARSTQTVFFEAPLNLTSITSTDASRASAFEELDSLGVRALRINLRWSEVAPLPDDATRPTFDATDPAFYNWGNYGKVMDEAKKRGWTVLISLSSPVPKWATESKADNLSRPLPAEYKLFAQAAVRRFGTGRDVMWSVWNEPNLPRFLKPQLSGRKLVGAEQYRELYIAGREGVREAGSKSPVLFGETAPSGGANDGRVMPLKFMRAALCLSSKYKRSKKCKPLTIDGYAHHPYQFGSRKLKSDDVTYANINKLTSAIKKAAKAKAITKNVPLYYTEFGFQSLPDPLFGYPQTEFYERRARAERDAYFNSRVRSFSQYLLTDDADNGGFQSGLQFADGKPKPAFDAFRLPIDAKITGKKTKKVSIWGLARPADGTTTVIVQRATKKGKFKTWKKKLKTKSNGAFVLSDKYRSGARYRFIWTDSDTGTKYTSPPVHAWR